MSDLTNCAHEPIHIPGAIQPHGCLLNLDSDRLTVSQVSANVESFLGLAPEALLGRSLQDVLPEESADLLARAAGGQPRRRESPGRGDGARTIRRDRSPW